MPNDPKKKLLELVAAALCLGMLVVAFSPSMRAQATVWNKKTTVTFSAPVQIPGNKGTVVLPAGTYVFRLADVQRSQNIVQIRNQREDHVYATIIAISNYRLPPTGETVITFHERPAGTAPAIKAWFYPGERYGREFVYPKSQAVAIAAAAGEPVLSMPEAEAADITQPIETGEEPAAKALEAAPVMAEEPSGAEVPMADVVQTSPSQQSAPASLPATGSDMPLLLLGGTLLLGMGIGLRLLSRKSA